MLKFSKSVESVRNSLTTLIRIAPLLWRSEPIGVTLMVLFLGLEAAIPALTLLLTKWSVDEITKLGQPGNAFPTFALIGSWALLQLIQPFFNVCNQLLQGNIAEKFTAYINLELMAKAEEIRGLDALEDKAFYNDLKIIQEGAQNRPMNLVILLALTARDMLTMVSLMAILATLAWWVPLALIAAILPATLATIRLRDAGFKALLRNSEAGRRMAYYSRIALSFSHAHEVRLFGLIPWLKERYTHLFLSAHIDMKRVRRKEATHVLPTFSLSIVVSAGMFAWAIWKASLRQLTAGQVVILVQALSQAIFALRDIANYIGLLHERILYFDKYFSFLGIASGVRQPQNPVFLEQRQAYTIEFNKVGFTYPDGRTALADVSFKILAGETIALVGENGAGKSTIVKLLLRFYDPTSGRILVNGCDLKTLDLAQWRKRVGAVFQDFNRYDLSLRENIALADLSNLSDEQKLTRVVDKVALSDLMRELPEGLDTKLGKEFGGTELSGGQWQKIAIARGLLKGVSVLILDEPTASVDPRSEFEIFERFAKII